MVWVQVDWLAEAELLSDLGDRPPRVYPSDDDFASSGRYFWQGRQGLQTGHTAASRIIRGQTEAMADENRKANGKAAPAKAGETPENAEAQAQAETSGAPEKGAAKAKAAKDDTAGEQAAPKAKKEKPPAPEDKPFSEFIQQEYLPALQKAIAATGIGDLELTFGQETLPSVGETCWQVRGRFAGGQRLFGIAFIKEDINGPKFFFCADNSSRPSTLEHFMGDERKVTLDLLVLYTAQRLNAQKWLARN